MENQQPRSTILTRQSIVLNRGVCATRLNKSTSRRRYECHSSCAICRLPQQYKYVVRFNGPAEGEDWSVVIWNKLGPDGIQGGWYGKACRRFTLAAGQSRFLAFDENSQGGCAAAPGTAIPLDPKGGYASTWGEFDFGSSVNHGWSGFDVSAIQAQNAGLEVQGMQICDVLTHICSAITRDASHVQNAYTWDLADVGGIGGNLAPGPVRLQVALDYAK